MNELEQELAQARELLDQSHYRLPVGASSHTTETPDGVFHNGQATMEGSPVPPTLLLNQNPAANGSPREGAIAHRASLPAIPPATITHSSPPQVPDPSPKFSLETPLASGDFEWDERIVSNVDGMASLTDRYSRGGYLGVASGAALLRLADSGAQPAIDTNDADLTQEEPSQVHTPITRVSYSLSQLEPFVDAYFQLYHISYPIVHEATFRAQVSVDGNSCHVVCAD